MKVNLLLILGILPIATIAQVNPAAFLSIQTFFGTHNIQFKEYAKSPGASFGFKVSLGIYAVQQAQYEGGLQVTFLEGASWNKERREMSEAFELPNPDFDKHRFFRFAQFRSTNIGWFSEFPLAEATVHYTIGLGIFGTTELDQLFDLGLHNALALHIGDSDFKGSFGMVHDAQIGKGNPNYTMSNLGATLGGMRAW